MKRKLIKIISFILVFNIIVIPAAAFAPANQYHKVQAAETVVDSAFFNAILIMLGVTSVMAGNMSPTFSIPSADFDNLKNQFQATLDADATKKAAWMKAQTDYLAGGVAKTMGALELAKIGITDLYNLFKQYINDKISTSTIGSVSVPDTTYQYNFISKCQGIEMYATTADVNYFTVLNKSLGSVSQLVKWDGDYIHKNLACCTYDDYANYHLESPYTVLRYKFFDSTGQLVAYWETMQNGRWFYLQERIIATDLNQRIIIAQMLGVDVTGLGLSSSSVINGSIFYINTDNVINSNSDSISVIPTIPWVDSSITSGTIVTPALSEPYAGAVPIDVPITVPADNPSTPVDPPVEDDNTTIGKILAALIPISGILSGIQTGVGSISDVMATGFDSVIDGIGDIAGTLTGGITSSLSNVQSSLSSLTAPTTENINLDPVKNIPKVLFAKFPFCIPWDIYNVYNLMATDNRSPPEFKMSIPLSNSATLSNFGMPDLSFDLKLENYEEIAGVVRTAELLLFVIGLIFATKKLIWS